MTTKGDNDCDRDEVLKKMLETAPKPRKKKSDTDFEEMVKDLPKAKRIVKKDDD